MKKLSIMLVIGGSVAISACATRTEAPPPPITPAPAAVATGAELRGYTARVEGANGMVTTAHFMPDGRLYLVPAAGGSAVQGRWWVENEMLCTDYQPRGRECWPYRTAFQTNETVNLTSDRGQQVRFTLLSNPAMAPNIAPPPTTMPPPRRAGERG